MSPELATADIKRALETLVAELRAAAGDNIISIALYGGLAKGRYTPGISDVNVLIVVRATALAELERLAPVLTAARRAARVAAFVATPADLLDAARLFPVKTKDMQLAHRVLYGTVLLSELTIDAAALRLRAQQELANMRLRLRQRVVERGADPRVLWGGLVQSLPKLAVTLETCLQARSPETPGARDRAGVLRQAARTFSVPAELLEPFLSLHREDPAPADAMIRELFDRYLALLDLLAQRLAAMSP